MFSLVLNGNLADHWPDFLTAAFIAAIGWLLKRDISGMDKRHERAENKFAEVDKTTAEHDKRIAVLEDRVPARDRN